MSVVFKDENGWVLDACALIDQGNSRCIGRKAEQTVCCQYGFKQQTVCCQYGFKQQTVCCQYGFKQQTVCCQYGFKQQCFGVLKSHFSARRAADIPSKKRKRKCSELNQGEIDSLAYHEKIRSVILEGTNSLVDAVRSRGFLNGVIDAVEGLLPAHECNLSALCDMAKGLPLVEDDGDQKDPVQFLGAEESCTSHLDLFSRITENSTDWALEVPLMGENYVIPPHTAFLLSDFTRMKPLVHYGKRFDIIVLDPPWENKSLKRSGRYSSLPSSQLKRLPVPLLAASDCLVVTWVTNRPSHMRFVRDELYPHWGVDVLAEWFWVKVTRSGEFVFPLDSQHKKPYEVLVVGRYGGRENTMSSSGKSGSLVEDQRVIVSVPSVLHSHKPSLSEVLKPYVPAEAKCLELFARSLQPGWTSWGNEVIKFQHTNYFTMKPTDEATDIVKDRTTSEHTDKPTHSSVHTDKPTHSSVHTDKPTHSSVHTDKPTHSSVHTDKPTHSSVHTDKPTHSSVHTDKPTHSSVHTDKPTHSSVHTDKPTHSSVHTDKPTHSPEKPLLVPNRTPLSVD